jgi:N-acetylmuramoyl-L-alanine amidase
LISPRKTPARHFAIFGTMFLVAVALYALGRQQQPQPSQPQPAPPPYKNSFPVTHADSTSPTSTTTPAPKPQTPVKTPAERLHNALIALPPLQFHPTTIVIDPAHGGSDNGSRISDNIVEKDVTLALAFRLRSLLTARGFNVVLTREDDKAASPNPPFAPLTLDDRAGIANHERPSACIFIHATGTGSGVHLYTSELTPTPGELPAAPWLTLQAAWVPQSQHLAGRLGDALNRSHIPLVNGSASIRPVDSAACPALVFELAPRTDDPDSINEDGYQQSVAQAAANALILWKDAVQPPAHLSPPEPASTTAEPTKTAEPTTP